MASGSRFEELAKAKKAKIDMLEEGVEDKIKQKQLEAKLSRIDDETSQRVEEIKNEPVNTELIKEQALSNLESTKRANARDKENSVSQAEGYIKEAEKMLLEAQKNLKRIEEDAAYREKESNLQATQEYDRIMASAGNTEQTINLRIQKVEQEANALKRNIQIELDNITIKNDAQADSIAEYDSLYEDMKNIAVKVGSGTQ